MADRPTGEIAAASAAAAESALRRAHADSAFGYAFWLLTQIPLAARSPNFNASLQKVGLRTDAEPTMLAVVGAFTEAVDRRIGVARRQKNCLSYEGAAVLRLLETGLLRQES